MGETMTFPTVCGSVAGKASRLGVALHEAGYRSLGLDYRYIAIGTDDLATTVSGVKALGWRGFGVSMPFKVAITSHLDIVSPEVSTIGACNTVVHEDGGWTGYNTDWRGALDALAEAGVKRPGTALIVGAGGAARAIAYGLSSTGCQVTIAARNQGAGQRLCTELGLSGCVHLEDQSSQRYDVLVNATPVATIANGAVDLTALKNAEALLDVVFSPRDTELVARARSLGLQVAPGWRMLLHQALHQFRHYTGQAPPVQAMETVLRDSLA